MKKLNKIKNGFISRQIGVAKLAIKTGHKIYKNRGNDLKTTLKNSIESHVEEIVSELGVMKGSLMKAGQMLSLFGGAFLPEEAQKVLKSLENNSSYLEWDKMKKQIPQSWQDKIEIVHTPFAAASLGQVHKVKISGKEFAMKIQYAGVRKAIKNDVKALKMLIKALGVIPKEMDLVAIYNEVETMLRNETNYLREKEKTIKFKKNLKDFNSFHIPKIVEEYCNEDIITMELLEGHDLHDIDNLELTQSERNELGREFMRLLFLELFVFEEIQSDAHFGNYLILKKDKPSWGLIDFGATKETPKVFIKNYQKLVMALSKKDHDQFFQIMQEMNYISKNKETDKELLWEYILLFGEPFNNEIYDWGKTEIAQELMDYIPKIIKSVSIGNPPSDAIFVDRKVAGVYFILQKIKSQFNVNEVLAEVLAYKESLKNE